MFHCRGTTPSGLDGWHTVSKYCIVFYLSISIALLSGWDIQKRYRLQHWYCVGVNTPKRYRQLRVKDLPKILMWQLQWDSNLRPSGTEPHHWATTPHESVKMKEPPVVLWNYMTDDLLIFETWGTPIGPLVVALQQSIQWRKRVTMWIGKKMQL